MIFRTWVVSGSAYTLLFLLLLTSNSSVFAQRSMYVSFMLVNQMSFLRSMDEVSQIKKMPTYSLGSSLIVKLELSKRLMFNYGAHYSPQGQKYFLPEKDYSGSLVLRYGKLPLYLQYNYIVRDNFRAFVSAGIQPTMLVLEEGSIPVFFNDKSLDIFHPGSLFHEFGIEGLVTTGFDIRIFDEVFFTTEIRMDHGLNRADKNTFMDYTYSNGYDIVKTPLYTIRDTRNMTLGLSGGLTFKVR